MTDLLLETDRLRKRPCRHDETHARSDRYAARSTSPPLGTRAVQVCGTGAPVGTGPLLTLPDAEAGEAEIGWHLHPDAWGHGYASEAARLLDHAFACGLREAPAVCHLEDDRSTAATTRISMRDRGVTDRWYDGPSRLVGATRAEWAGGRG